MEKLYSLPQTINREACNEFVHFQFVSCLKLAAHAQLFLRSLPFWWKAVTVGHNILKKGSRLHKGYLVGGAAGVGGVAAMGYKRKHAAPPTVVHKKMKGSGAPKAHKVKSRWEAHMKGKKLHYGAGNGPKKHKRVKKKGAAVLSDKADQFSGDLIEAKFRQGKKISKLKLTEKLSMAATQPTYLRFQGLTAQDSATGYFSLGRFNVGVPPALTTTQTMPCYLFNLTSIGALQTNESVAVAVCTQAQRSWTATGAQPDWLFNAVLGNNSAGSSASQQPYAIEAGIYNQTYVIRDLLEWVEIGIDCIGATNDPMKWTIEIVQFKDDYYCPEYSVVASAAYDTLMKQNARNQFWDHELIPETSHPFNVQAPIPSVKKAKRVLWAQSFTTQPKSNSDLYTVGEERRVKIFKRLNRIQEYQWSVSGRGPPVVAGVDQLGWPVNLVSSTAGSAQGDVEPRKRLYLMVKAQCPTVNTAATVCGSMDVMIRKKHMSMA